MARRSRSLSFYAETHALLMQLDAFDTRLLVLSLLSWLWPAPVIGHPLVQGLAGPAESREFSTRGA